MVNSSTKRAPKRVKLSGINYADVRVGDIIVNDGGNILSNHVALDGGYAHRSKHYGTICIRKADLHTGEISEMCISDREERAIGKNLARK